MNNNVTPQGHSASQLRSVADITRAMKAKRGAALGKARAPYVAPETKTQETMARIWAEMLFVEGIGIDDDFFDLGGHSLLATQVVSKMRAAFGWECQLHWLFEAPTIRAFADYLDRAGRRGTTTTIPFADRANALPLSFSQQRLWFLDQYQPGSAFYNIPLAVHLLGPLNVDVLARALNEVVRRHESLRTVFASDAGTPRQVILPELKLSLPLEDLSAMAAEAEQETRTQALIQEEAARPFNLASGPLLRPGLIRLGAQDHILMLTLHHTVADGWSIGVLAKEVGALYGAFLSGHSSPLPDLPVQYADFSAWQRDWLRGDVLDAQVEYWKRQLADAPPLLELPTDRPRPAVPTHRGATCRFGLLAPLTRRLYQLAREQNVTLFMLLVGAFDVLLARHSGQDDICLGTSVAGRDRSEFEGLIGFFANTLVLRTKVVGEERFSELLARVRGMAVEAYAHQDVPFEHLVEALKPQRTQSYSPLFQVMLNLQNTPQEQIAAGTLQFSVRPTQSQTAKFDLTCSLWESEDYLSGAIEYSSDLFDEATIQRLVERYQVLLEGICIDPHARVCDLPLVTPVERKQLHTDWNDTASHYPSEKTASQLFEEQVRLTPDAVAVCFENVALTYSQLNVQANRLAHHLRSLGVGPEVLVGLYVERGLDMVVGLLGILKSGGGYIPLDPAYPVERVVYMLQDSVPRVVVTQSSLAAKIPRLSAEVVCLDGEWTAEFRKSGDPSSVSGPEDTAYVIYTSGSTGQPKGVQIPHRAFVNFLTSVAPRIDFQHGDTLLAVTSLSFDIAGLELCVPLLCGGKLIIAPIGAGENPQELELLMQRHSVTVMQATPTTWRLMQAHRCAYRLRLALCGGEELDPSLRRFLASTHTELWNMYGPTETTVWSTLARLHETGPITLGHPLANTQVYVLDKWTQPVPIGVAGELHIGGDGLARGYLNRPELTDQKFIPDPFSQQPGARLYRTGDLARRLSDGTLEYLGRIDHQVKLRGFRIELGEIEAALQEVSSVAQAVVVVREDAPGDRRLVAYLAAHSGQLIDKDALRARLTARLPEYMVPGCYVVLDAFPRTPNGKTDRKALPAPSSERSTHMEHIAPRTDVERRLAAIWGKLLRTEVGVRDSFFELGGHSLLAVQMMAQIRTEFGQDLPLQLLFDNATIEAIAARLKGESVAPPVSVPTAAQADDYPATPAQAQLWHHFRVYPRSSAYNLVGSTDLPDEISDQDLHDVVNFLLARHEVLRTVFFERNGDVRQRLLPLKVAEIREHQLDEEGSAREASRAEAVVPFDLEHGPLFRVLLVRQADSRKTLSWSTHHIIFDAASLEILNREVATLFGQIIASRRLDLPPVKVQFKDFAVWQASEPESKRRLAGRDYWASVLSGELPSLNLPFDFPVSERNHMGGAAYSCTIEEDVSGALRALAEGEQATLFMVLLTAWYVVLHRATDQTDLIVGAPVAGRPHGDLKDTIGFFVNTIMLRIQLDPKASFLSLLREVRSRVLLGLEHHDYPFDELLADLRIKRQPMRFPISTVFFNMWNFGAMDSPATGEQLGHREVHQEMKFDLDIYIRTTASEQLILDCHYRTALFKPQTIQYFFGEFCSLLRQLTRVCESTIEALPIFEPQTTPGNALGSSTVVARPHRPIDSAASVVECFRAIARANSAAVAVETDRQCWTYGELDAATDVLASRLLHSSGPGNGRVALLLSHGWNAVVGVLSVLKAGKAYVPLDPRHPMERLRLIAADADVEAWLTDDANTGAATSLAHGKRLLQIHAEDEVGSTADETLLHAAVLPAEHAYLIYTSGSTGRPKGVLQTNEGVLHYLRRHTTQLSIQYGDKYVALASYSFEAGVKGILAPLLTGATICPFDLKGAQDLSSLGRFLATVDVTIWHSVPSVYRQFLREEATRCNEYPSLRVVILSGDELLSTDIDQHFRSNLRNADLINLYGLTEASLNAIWKVESVDTSPLRLGYPLGSDELRILRQDGTPARVYEVGEIVVDSQFVAKGYWGDPQLSQERFQLQESGKTRLRTGDLGRWLPDGGLQLCGRRGDQVKINGYRIELSEIEAAALSLPSVFAASALLSAAANGERHLALCVELSSGLGAPVVVPALKAHLREILPDYMIPLSITVVDRIPYTPNGKVDRVALFAVRHDAPPPKVAPRNQLEQELCALVVEVLQLDDAGVDDNFFDLGGHSLLAMRLISRIREGYQVDLALQELFSSPTVASMARLIDTELSARNVLGAPTASYDSQTYESVEF